MSPVTESSFPLVSIVIPCRNEAAWIAACLDSLDRNDYPQDRLEVFIVDGMSGQRNAGDHRRAGGAALPMSICWIIRGKLCRRR